jgi:SAM-dependent methyltransferase
MNSYSEKPVQYFGYARKEIEVLLPAVLNRALEVGCGSGATLRWLTETKAITNTVGIEISPVAAQLAKEQVQEVYCMNFERDAIPANLGVFDLVLCLDVLEHMVDPWAAVSRLVSNHLQPGGTIIISLPNVRHYSVVFPLLTKGVWPYEDAGLLDRTHLRFFTRSSAMELLSGIGLSHPRYMATGFEKRSLKGILNFLTAGIFQEFVTYQHYLVAHKL